MGAGDSTAIAKGYHLNNLGYRDKPQIESLERSQDKVCSMNDHEFELFCVEQLREIAKKEALKDFQITHNKKVERIIASLIEKNLVEREGSNKAGFWRIK